MKKSAIVLIRIVSILSIILIILSLAVFVGPRLAGMQPYVVLSGSMQPTYPTGSVIYVRKASASQVSVGNPITFRLSGSTIVTHRAVRIDAAKQLFYTKGDANNTEDPSPVPFGSLIGKPVFHIPYLGFFEIKVNSLSGKIAVITMFACLMFFAFLPDMLFKKLKPIKPVPVGKELERDKA
jgi:signal peptidase